MIQKNSLETNALSVSYGKVKAINNINLAFPEKEVTAIIGPSGCGKSTFVRTLNRMNDFTDNVKIEGEVLYDNINIYDKNVNPVEVRRCIGMVFQKPNPFPKTIYENIAWGLKLESKPSDLDDQVEQALSQAFLWDEVKDRLNESALSLSGGQQQRLCIARSLAINPDILLMDEPCSALDPISTASIEELLTELKKRITIIIVTHNLRQAKRVSSRTAFFEGGSVIEYEKTEKLFSDPTSDRTRDYIGGLFG